MAGKCLKCNKKYEKGIVNLIQCDCCNKWEHQECTYLKDVPETSLSDIPYYCDVCAIKMQYLMKENSEMKQTIDQMKTMMECMAKDMKCVKADLSTTSAKVNKLDSAQLASWMNYIADEIGELKGEIKHLKDKEKSDEIKNKLEKVTSDLKNVTNNMDGKKGKPEYADSLKSKKMLIVKSTNNEKTAVENKKEIISKMKTPVEAVTETKDGHLAVRFDSKKNLEAAKQELNGNTTDQISVNEKGKFNQR